MQRYEYMRFNADQSDRNNFAVSVHHPLQRWADGMYVALWHSDPASAVGFALNKATGAASTDGRQTGELAATATVTPTHVVLRLDYYAYRPWDAVEVPAEATIPAGGHVDIDVRFTVPGDAAPGALQGAIFVDHSRGTSEAAFLPATVRRAPLAPGDERAAGSASRRSSRSLTVAGDRVARLTDLPIAPAPSAEELDLAPGGYELPFLRTVIPVNANVAAAYDWRGAVNLGGAAARDPDSPYDNGATRGTFTWDWREESGDWRFFFVDAASVDSPMRWLMRTTWTDTAAGSSDIDTRMYGPASDPFTAAGEEGDDMVDPDWYGPHTLELVGRSPYLVQAGTVWPFDTSSGRNEDWVSAPASEGLHELLLHNVLYAGSDFELPFGTEVGSVQLSTDELRLVGDTCGSLVLTPTLALPELQVTAYGPAAPTFLADLPAVADNPDDPASATFRHRLELAGEAGQFVVSLVGEADDDLDLYLLFDADDDGELSFDDERIGESAGVTAEERIELPGVARAGTYEIWVHGYLVEGADSVFDLRIDVVSGKNLIVDDPPPGIEAGQSAALRVCVDVSGLAPSATEASGLLFAGPSAAPRLIGLPVAWQREP